MAKPGLVKTDLDTLTFRINGLAMQTHNELKAGHAEKFYQRRLAELCKDAGLAVEIEKRVEVWIGDKQIGYLILDLWAEETLVVECKSFPHSLGTDEIGQVLTYLAATGNAIGMLYNFGRKSLEYKRILAPKDVQDWQASLYRYIHKSPEMKLPPLTGKDKFASVPPIRFKSVEGKRIYVEIPSPTGAAIRLSASRQPSVPKSAYENSGVSIDAGNHAVDLMKDVVKSTYTPSVLSGLGSFGGLFDVSALKAFDHPVLVASTDGVGTKVKLAASIGRYRGIGHDIVNHCINDILVQGARPLFFMDYFATSKLTPEVTAEVVTGMAEACKESGVALLGGETAEMPGVYQPNEFDVAGTIVGVVERDDILPRNNLQAGDVLIGLTSSGPHTNGYSLIRKLVGLAGATAETQLDGRPLFDRLLAPTRIYVRPLLDLARRIAVHGLAHITGGGLTDNIPRTLPAGLEVALSRRAWHRDPLFDWLQRTGSLPDAEMYRTFNCGIGMVVVVADRDTESALSLLRAQGEIASVIGSVRRGDAGVVISA